MAYGLLRSPCWSWCWTPCAKNSPWRSWLFHHAEFGEPSASSHFHHWFHCGWVCSSSCNLFVRDPSLYISHRPVAHSAETVMVKRFQFGSIFFCSTAVVIHLNNPVKNSSLRVWIAIAVSFPCLPFWKTRQLRLKPKVNKDLSGWRNRNGFGNGTVTTIRKETKTPSCKEFGQQSLPPSTRIRGGEPTPSTRILIRCGRPRQSKRIRCVGSCLPPRRSDWRRISRQIDSILYDRRTCYITI
jgi:hypothetical protein